MANARSNLECLPIELLDQIIALLSKTEVKALRFTCRQLHIVASKKIFETLTISTTQDSFVQLLNVAGSEFWSAQVRHVHWVLLNCSDIISGRMQCIRFKDIKSFGSWTTSLKPFGGLNGKPSYYGLDLQCQLMRRIPNVQTIRFWCATSSQRSGIEPWEENRARSKIVKRSYFKNPTPGVDPNADDIFSILRHSNLRPRLVQTILATVHLKYALNADFEHVVIVPTALDRTRRFPEIYRGYKNEEELDFIHEKMGCIWSLAHSGITTLKTLDISSQQEFSGDMTTSLRSMPNRKFSVRPEAIGKEEGLDDDFTVSQVNVEIYVTGL